jgi:hypothetical protein
MASLVRCVALGVALLAGRSAFAACEGDTQPSGVPIGEEDCDGDGWTKGEGDCNDELETVNPGKQVDICEDSDDNNCDGYFNEGCELAFARGSLSGGSACQDATVSSAALLPALLLLARRRGRAS